MTKDFLGRELAVDDFVVFMKQHYRELKLAKIKRFTKTGKPYICWQTKWGERELLQNGSQLVKVEGPDLTAFLLTRTEE
jgi:uncharacterized phage-like protein YoqJ